MTKSDAAFARTYPRLPEMLSGRGSIIYGPKKGDMVAIDYASCGVNDVIAYSQKLHPQQLAARLRFHARVHAEFCDAYDDCEVTQSELDLADRLRSLADAIEREEFTMPDDADLRREAFGGTHACREYAHQIGARHCEAICGGTDGAEFVDGLEDGQKIEIKAAQV